MKIFSAAKGEDHQSSFCCLCAGILQTVDRKDYVCKVVQQIKAEDFEYTSFMLKVTFPNFLYLRQAHMIYWLWNDL